MATYTKTNVYVKNPQSDKVHIRQDRMTALCGTNVAGYSTVSKPPRKPEDRCKKCWSKK
jgi:hypothetical protein